MRAVETQGLPGVRGAVSAASAALVAASLAASPLAAQTIRGTATTAGGTEPIPGVVVLLVDPAGTTIRRALTDERGTFILAAPGAGRYAIRALRIGFRPTILDARDLRSGEEVPLRIEMSSVPATLGPIIVTERRTCGTQADSGSAAAALWDAARTALIAQQLTAASQHYVMRFYRYERAYVPRGDSIAHESREGFRGPTMQAFASLPPDTLARVGYVEQRGSDVYYQAPDAEVLLSARFARDHCFGLTASADPDQRMVGLTFRPARRRLPARFVDVEGTLWLDRASSELRHVQYSYVGLPREQSVIAGGRVEFLRLATGGWVVHRWEIRMPVMRVLADAPRPGLMKSAGMRRTMGVDRVHTSGGVVLDVSRDGRMVWTSRTARLAGIVRRPSAGDTVERLARVRLHRLGLAPDPPLSPPVAPDSLGRFVMDSLEPGAHRLLLVNLEADSLAIAPDTLRVTAGANDAPLVELRAPSVRDVVRRLCGRDAGDEEARAVVGVVRSPDGSPMRGATVEASFLARVSTVAGERLAATTASRAVRADEQGRFLLCDIPAERPVELRARHLRFSSDTLRVHLSPSRAYGVVEMVIRE